MHMSYLHLVLPISGVQLDDLLGIGRTLTFLGVRLAPLQGLALDDHGVGVLFLDVFGDRDFFFGEVLCLVDVEEGQVCHGDGAGRVEGEKDSGFLEEGNGHAVDAEVDGLSGRHEPAEDALKVVKGE